MMAALDRPKSKGLQRARIEPGQLGRRAVLVEP